jgi:hypothetical protein
MLITKVNIEGRKLKFWGSNALFTLLILISQSAFSQILNADSPVLEEFLRRKQLLEKFDSTYSFQLRPYYFSLGDSSPALREVMYYLSGSKIPKKEECSIQSSSHTF